MVGKEKENEWSQNSQPMHDGKSPGSLAIHLVLCNREWTCVVSAICDEWQRGTFVDGKAMQPTTSTTNRLQPQLTHQWSRMPHHTPQSTHTMMHAHGWMVVQRLDDHIVMTNTPWIHGNHSLYIHHCAAQHPHPTHHSCRLLGDVLGHTHVTLHHQWLGKRGVVHAMCFHSTPFTLVHPFAPYHSLCV